MDHKIKVLVVDDEPEFAELFGFLLISEGLEVDWAFDGDEALSKLRQDCFDYVISDFNMPNLSGDFLFKMAESELEKMPKFIFISGYPEDIKTLEKNEHIIGIYEKTVHHKHVAHIIKENITKDSEHKAS